jgi:hypothetical protein
MSVYDEIKTEIDKIVDKYKTYAGDGVLTFAEVWKIVALGTHDIVVVLDKFAHSGADKKIAALEAVDRFYADVIKPIDIKAVPNIVEPVVDKALGAMVHSVADGVIEALVNISKIEE